jgi:hypothetical protein
MGGVPTVKQSIRIPPGRYAAAQRRAGERGTDATKVVNAALAAYAAGALDEVLGPWLADPNRDGQSETSQQPAASSR